MSGTCVGCAILAALPVLAACNSAPGSASSTTHSTAVGIARPLSDRTAITPGYFGGNEKFCARSPLSGTIAVSGSRGTATMEVHVGGLPSTTQVAVSWANGTGRAYVVASVDSDATGSSVQSTVLLYRPGEVRGARIILALADPQATVVGDLEPCS